MSASLDSLLDASADFNDHLLALVQRFGGLRGDLRSSLCAAACQLTVEHAQGVRILVSHRAANSGCALLRSQYEALLRASWLLYCARDPDLARAGGDLDTEGQRFAQGLPGAKEMLDALVKAAISAPALNGLVLPLQEIHASSWRALNSYVHAGLHPLQRVGAFPVALAEQIVRTSNGMLQFSVRLLYRLSERPAVSQQDVERSYLGYEHCLPGPAAMPATVSGVHAAP